MSARKNHRFADIVSNGIPIVNIGKLVRMRPSARSPFGQRLYEARKRAKLTQGQAAKALKISQGTLSELENSGQGSAHTVGLANLYGCDPNWLATGEGSHVRSGPGDTSPPAPPRTFRDRREVTESDWALLQDIKDALSSPRLAQKVTDIRAEVDELRAFAENVMKKRSPIGGGK